MSASGRYHSSLFVFVCALASCGSGSNGNAPAVQRPIMEDVSGTLPIESTSSETSRSERKPAFVGAATTHANVWINGLLVPSNASSTCTGTQTTGTGTFCTVSWNVNVPVPASYNFQVETDDGTDVLAEGSKAYVIVAGTNALSALTLNGVVAKATFATTTCTAGTAGITAGTCAGTVTLQENGADAIAYTGSATVPVAGLNPTSGTIFDNGSVTLAASAASGLVTGTAQTGGSNVYSSFASNTLTISGVNTTGVYTYGVACATATTSGTFGITLGGSAGRTSGVNVLDTQLANATGAPAYPSSTITVTGTAPSYTCTNGVISSATVALPIN
jgi:hypothetical protein